MSLYTPVFPAFNSRDGFPENSLVSGGQRNYVEFLRDIHLFLSTQADMLSPPSRPSSPMFDHRVQKMRDEIQGIFNATDGETSSGKWTRLSQSLKLGCARGRPRAVLKPDLCTLDEDMDWILPEEESEWIEWEKKREESRRLKGKTNAPQQVGSDDSATPVSRKPSRSSARLSQRHDMTRRQWPPPDVSPATLQAAKEKVRKWQASVSSGVWHDTTSGSSLASGRTTVTVTAPKGKIGAPQRSHTLGFTVVKPAAKPIVGKAGNSLSRPDIRGPTTLPSHKSKSPNKSNVPGITAPVDAKKSGSKKPLEILPVGDTRKIADVPESPFLPPSFPAHLKTSTPPANSGTVTRAKPSPILPIPALLSTPPPSSPTDPPGDRLLVPAEPHAVNASSSHSPQIGTVQPGKNNKRCRESPDGVADAPVVASPTKKVRTILESDSVPASEHPKPISPNEGLDIFPCAGVDSSVAIPPSDQCNADPVGTALDAPLTPGKHEDAVAGAVVGQKPRSPTKSVKSFFSAPDSDLAESPVRANLLLESPVSPMLSYAQGRGIFMPQITSTQVAGSPTAGRTNGGTFGMGYSSQFDIEKHVDRVSELLERDVDFDGWLRTVETNEE